MDTVHTISNIQHFLFLAVYSLMKYKSNAYCFREDSHISIRHSLKKKVLQERATLNRKQVQVDNFGKRSYTDLELLCESNTTLSFVNTLKTNIHNHKNSHHKLDFEEKQTGVECRCHNDIFLEVINYMVHAVVHVNVRYSSQRRVLT